MEKLKKNSIWILSGALIVFSLVVFFSARAFSSTRTYVDVKGLSEKIVKADTAVWSISFNVQSNSIDDLSSQIGKDTNAIKSFLVSKGFDSSEINVAPINIYQNTYKDAIFRYNANSQVSLYTKKVDLVKSASKDTLTLIKEGIPISQNSISFNLSDINSIKPEMLKESISNAEATAQEIAKGSRAHLGKIIQGNQGVFAITEKDPGSPEYKKVRLVSTLRFALR